MQSVSRTDPQRPEMQRSEMQRSEMQHDSMPSIGTVAPVSGAEPRRPVSSPHSARPSIRETVLMGVTEKRLLFAMSALLFVALSVFMVIAYRSEAAFYSEILTHARQAGSCAENVMAFEVALAPFRSLSVVRTAALFLSFVLVILGSLFVLTGIEVAYRMSLELGEKKAALETASPGLVLVTAGGLLIAASLYRGGSPEFRPAPCAPNASALSDVHTQLNPTRLRP